MPAAAATSTATTNSASCTPLSRASRAPVPEDSTNRSDRGARRLATRSGYAASTARRKSVSAIVEAAASAHASRDVPKLVSHAKHVRRQTLVAIDRREAGRRSSRRGAAMRRADRQAARTRARLRARRPPRGAAGSDADEAAAAAVRGRAASAPRGRRSPRAAGADRARRARLARAAVRTTRASAGSPPHAITSSTVDARSTRAISGSRAAAGDRAASHSRTTRPACVRPARPARWSAESCGMRSVSRLSIAAVGVVARHLVLPGVDDRHHVGHRQRRLRDVRRENHAPVVRRLDRGVLLVGVERAVQRQDAKTGRRRDPARGSPSPGESPARQAENRARRPRRGGRISIAACSTAHARPIGDLDGMRRGPARRSPGSRPRNAATRAESSVADMTTIRRSSRARQAWRASASPRSAWMLRS